MIGAERNQQPVPDFIAVILRAHGQLDLSLSPVTVAELARSLSGQDAGARRAPPRIYRALAAAAIEQGYVVLTGNVRHFRRIPGLTVVTL